MKIAFGLHLRIGFKNIQDFQSDIRLLENQTQKTVWLTGEENQIKKQVQEINKVIDEEKLLIISETTFFELGLNVSALICRNFNDIDLFKNKYPNLKIGGIGSDIAECKNIEHFNGDFVYLGPLEKIGVSPYLILTPEKPDYEWRFIDITIPVIAFGMSSLDTLSDITEKTNLFGFGAVNTEFKKLAKVGYRFVN